MDTLFVPIRFSTYVQLPPNELDEAIDARIYQKLRTAYEGQCSRFGYIQPGSTVVVKRSCGNFMKPHFNGHTRFNVMCKAKVCNPVQGTIVKAMVRNKNQLGILAESILQIDDADPIPILDIIIPRRSAGISSQVDIDTIEIGSWINVEVIGKRYQMKDTKISIIGRIVKDAAITIPEDEVVDEDVEGGGGPELPTEDHGEGEGDGDDETGSVDDPETDDDDDKKEKEKNPGDEEESDESGEEDEDADEDEGDEDEGESDAGESESDPGREED